MLTRRKFLHDMPFISAAIYAAIKSVAYAASYDAKTILESIISSQSNWDEKSAKNNAKVIIEYSAGIKNDDEMNNFLKEMKKLTDKIADEKYGNKNDIAEDSEINDMRKKNKGINGICELYKEYGL